ncbi:MAG: hypothetical protein K0S29_931 [Gammaproteobacteria bacterium]|nr:hypothetical protein [Gammaproteobacteria bacterium]
MRYKQFYYPANHFICWAILCLLKSAVKYQTVSKLHAEQWVQAYLDIEKATPAGRLLIKISQHRSAQRKYYQEMAMESGYALAVSLLICADQSEEKWPQCEYENIMKLADMGFSLEYLLKLMVPDLNQLHPKENSYYQAINILLGLLEAKVKAEPGFMSKMLDITLQVQF